MKKNIVFILFFLTFLNSFSQGWEKELFFSNTTFTNEITINTIELHNGDFVAIGYVMTSTIPSQNLPGFVVRLNSQGDTLWSKLFWPQSPANSGSYIRLNGIAELSDYSLFIVGAHIDLGFTNDRTVIIKLNSNGSIISQTFVGINGNNYDHTQIKGLSNGEFYVGGVDTSLISTSNRYSCIKKYNSNGSLIWKKKNTIIPAQTGGVQHMAITSDSGLVVSYIASSSLASSIYKITKNGNILWANTTTYSIYDIVGTPNNTAILCASVSSFSPPYVNELIEVDQSGNIIWTKNLNYAPLKIVHNNYSGYTILGQGTILSGSPNNTRTFLVAYDSLWNTVWMQFDETTYRTTLDFNETYLNKSSDNGYVISGRSVIPQLGNARRAYVIKTDSLGFTYKGNMSGKVIEDVNTDCNFNGVDYGYKNIIVEANNGINSFYSFSQQNGDYSFKVDTGNYSITHFPKTYRTQICPTSNYYVSIASQNDTITQQDFFDHLTNNFTDMAVYLSPLTNCVPGNNFPVYISYTNYGTDTASGQIIFTYDSLLQLQGSSIIPTSTSSNTLTFNYSGIAEDSTFNIVVYFNVATTANIGDTILCNAFISTINTDVDTTSNTDVLVMAVVNSFDPNDKNVSPKGLGTQGYITGNEELEYIIRFQNTGTYMAQNILIRDSISNNLDFSTFQLLASSHNCTIAVENQRTIKFVFQNINLPDSTSNEPASHGFVKYSIKPKAGLAPATQIKNTAYIYFDFNAPIITNTTLNTIEIPNNIQESAKNSSIVKVYPNPFSDETTFVINSTKTNEIYSFELYDVLGKKVNELKNITAKQFSINRNNLENGMYFYKIYSSGSTVGIGKVIVQ